MVAEDRDVQPWLIAGRPAAGPVVLARPGGQVLDGHPGGEGGLGRRRRGTLWRVEGDLVAKAAQRLGKGGDALALAGGVMRTGRAGLRGNKSDPHHEPPTGLPLGIGASRWGAGEEGREA